MNRIVVALRTLAAAALVVVGAGAIVRTAAAAFDPFQPYPGHTANYGFVRPRAIHTALPSIARRPEKIALVFGSSGVARAFVPEVFDRSVRDAYVSWNLAQMLLQPETALAMATDVRRTFEAHDKRVSMVIFGISAPELARDSLRAAHRSMPDQPVAFDADLLFGNVKPSRVGRWIEDWAAARPIGCDSGMKQPPEGPEAYAALVDYCNELARQLPRGVPPWNPKTRGALDFGLPGTRPMLERLIALQPPLPAPPPPDATHIPPDDTDEEAVRTMIAAIREVAAVSDDVFVMRDILNPVVLAQFTPVQTARWRATAERIARESDARLLDFNDGSIVASDFGDRTHLHALAAERFSRELAKRVLPMVKEGHASR